MQRYFATNKNLDLEKTDIHHIINVMRMKENDKIEIIFEEVIYTCLLKKIDINNIEFDIIKKIENKDNNSLEVTIAISLVTEQKWDYILQKSTELNVSNIIPLELSRTLIKQKKANAINKYDRWNRICKEAAEQAHRLNIPKIYSPMTLTQLIKEEYDLKLVCSTGSNAKNLKELLSKSKTCGRIIIVVGPEGGITNEEEKYLCDNGFELVSLGKQVLRVETVPLYILSVINYEWMR